MRVYLKESERDELRLWTHKHTSELVEIKAKLLRHEATRTQAGTRLRGRLFAVAGFLRYDKTIRQVFEERE